MTQFLHDLPSPLRSHLHFDFRHWSQARDSDIRIGDTTTYLGLHTFTAPSPDGLLVALISPSPSGQGRQGWQLGELIPIFKVVERHGVLHRGQVYVRIHNNR